MNGQKYLSEYVSSNAMNLWNEIPKLRVVHLTYIDKPFKVRKIMIKSESQKEKKNLVQNVVEN